MTHAHVCKRLNTTPRHCTPSTITCCAGNTNQSSILVQFLLWLYLLHADETPRDSRFPFTGEGGREGGREGVGGQKSLAQSRTAVIQHSDLDFHLACLTFLKPYLDSLTAVMVASATILRQLSRSATTRPFLSSHTTYQFLRCPSTNHCKTEYVQLLY